MTPGGQDSAFPGVWSTVEDWHVFDQPRKRDTSSVGATREESGSAGATGVDPLPNVEWTGKHASLPPRPGLATS
jgi:hypothetical protein